jgi:hypothetical protein
MFDTSEVLETFYGDESFPVEWKSEEEKKLLWFFDDNHCPNPISPMYFSLHGWWGPTLDYMYRRFGFPIGSAWNGKRVNGYLYSAISPRDPKEAGMLGPYYGMVMPTYAEKFLEWWQDRYLPEVKANFNYLDTFDTENASLPELMVFLEEAIDIQERHFRLHWILNLAQFQSSITFQTLAGQVIPNVSGALIGRILISLEDRNWDSVRDLWQLKEDVKANPELKKIFESKETATAILPALQGSETGKAFMEQVTAYQKEYGYKPLYTHEYMFKLWVEDPAPCIETIKGYLASDYDFPAEFEKIKKDQQAAMKELRELIPADTPTEKVEALLEAMRLAVKMMPLTPDHHYYFDQGTFARLRLVLVAIGRKMVKLGLLRDAEDIMFLEYEQLRAYVANPKSEANPDGYDGSGDHQGCPSCVGRRLQGYPARLGWHRYPLEHVRRDLPHLVGLPRAIRALPERPEGHPGPGQRPARGSRCCRRRRARGQEPGGVRPSKERRDHGLPDDQPSLGDRVLEDQRRCHRRRRRALPHRSGLARIRHPGGCRYGGCYPQNQDRRPGARQWLYRLCRNSRDCYTIGEHAQIRLDIFRQGGRPGNSWPSTL